MSPLSGLKGRPLIALVLEPHAIDDSHPDVGQGSDGHTVAFPLLAFSVVVVLRPPFPARVLSQANWCKALRSGLIQAKR